MHSPFVPGRSQRLKWWWEDIRSARFSLGLVGLILGIEAVLSSLGGAANLSLHPVYQSLGLSRAGMEKGWIWQLVTHAVLHGGWLHVLVNAFLLMGTGARVERISDWKTAAFVFSAGALAGGLMFLAFPSAVPLVGASGGIFALLLWLTTVSPQSRMAPLPVSARNLGLGILIASAALMIASPWISSKQLPVSHACHFGGALVGWLIGRHRMRACVTLADLQKARARREAEADS